MTAALQILDELAERIPVEYDIVAGSAIIVFPTRLYDEFVPHLKAQGIKFRDVPVVPLSTLPPAEQAKRRGLSRPTNIT